MSEPTRSAMPNWLAGAVVTLLTFQVGLLWLQGSLLERQHADLQSLRQDVQDLSESLDDFQGQFDQGSEGGHLKSSLPHTRHRPLLRVRLQEQEEPGGARKELEDAKKSQKKAVEDARDIRSKLSIEENARKAEEKAKIEAETHKLRPFIWIGVLVALGAMFLRSWLRNRG